MQFEYLTNRQRFVASEVDGIKQDLAFDVLLHCHAPYAAELPRSSACADWLLGQLEALFTTSKASATVLCALPFGE